MKNSLIVLILAMMAFALQHVQVAAQGEAQVQDEEVPRPAVQARPSFPFEPSPPTPGQLAIPQPVFLTPQVRGQSELSKAIAQLKASETESDRENAEDAMRSALSEDYDASLDKYEEYLEQMEAKIKQLKNQLEKRRQAKMELVDLRLQMLVNEANGLGWPNSRTNGVFGQNFNGGPQWQPFVQPGSPFEQRQGGQFPNLSGDVSGR